MEFFFQDSAPVAPIVRRNPLFSAASRGDASAFSRALAEEGDAEGQYSVFEAVNGLNAVHIASRKNNIQIMEMILEKYGVRALESCTEDGRSPLMVAAAENAVEIMRLLCAQVKTLNGDVASYVMKADAAGNTALHHAAWRGNLPACRTLIEELGCDNPFVKNNDGMTPQQFAAAGNHTEVVEYLLRLQETAHHGAEASKTGINDLHRACMHGALETVALLLSRHQADASARTSNGNNALHVAAQNGYASIVKYLVEEAGVEMNVQNKFGLTPLHLGCSR
jgi:ankyrin repeat protein